MPPPSGPASALSTVADLVSAGGRRRGVAVLVVLAAAAVVLPVVLLLVFRSLDPTDGSGGLGLVLGLVVDLVALVLLVVVVAHRLTARKLRELARSLDKAGTRTARLEALLTRQGETLKSQVGTDAKVRKAANSAARGVGDRLQATQNLFALVPPRGPVPPLVGYVASPDVLLLLVQKLLTVRPRLAIECGSGTSSLFLALAVQQYGLDCRIVSLEHQLAYAESTRALLADHGVGHLVDVRHAPLTPTQLADHSAPWYEPAAYQDLHDIGLVFVDGPPADVGAQARYPMVPLLQDRFAGSCAILLDDMRRADEQGVAERWATRLEGFSYRYLHLTRGAGLFTREG